MEIYDINGQIIDPLAGKTLYVAGDSIAYGKGSAGGYGKCIADRYGMQLINGSGGRCNAGDTGP